MKFDGFVFTLNKSLQKIIGTLSNNIQLTSYL